MAVGLSATIGGFDSAGGCGVDGGEAGNGELLSLTAPVSGDGCDGASVLERSVTDGLVAGAAAGLGLDCVSIVGAIDG